MSKKGNKSSESRKSARIRDSFTIHYKIISQQEFEEKASFYLDRRTANRPPSKRYGSDTFSLDWASLESEIDYNPFLVKIFSYLDKKIDMLLYKQEEIIKHYTHQDQQQETRETGKCIDISGTGLSMLIPEKLKKDTILELSIEPPIYPPFRIVTLGEVGRVISTKAKGKSGYDISTTFVSINEDDREELIKYIFKRQRELISSKKQSDDFF